MNLGSYVVLKDDSSIIYILKEINGEQCLLKGANYRLYLRTTFDKIVEASSEQIESENSIGNKYRKILKKRNREKIQVKPLFGRILHIDGDPEYLQSCMELYKEVGIYAEGIYIDEQLIKEKIEKILLDITPDIIVITGHDYYNGQGIKDLNNYENTTNFMDAIRIIRKHFSLNDVCVIAGACGSNYEALIASGANFASSPKRINIHTYDPVVIAIKVASTSVDKNIDFQQALNLIENGRKAFGGVETKGKMRLFL